MKEIIHDTKLVAACGLYCAACRSYRKGSCPGCAENTKAGWCTVRACCKEHGWQTCAECREFADPALCAKHNNFIARVIGFVLRSDRRAGVLMIREKGLDGFAAHMTNIQRQSSKRA